MGDTSPGVNDLRYLWHGIMAGYRTIVIEQHFTDVSLNFCYHRTFNRKTLFSDLQALHSLGYVA